jgi:peptidase M28-like protein
MPFVRQIAQSCIRVVVAVTLISGAGILALAVALRQPTITRRPFHGSMRADEAVLQKHVQFLTENVRPRNASHPENLDRTITYIADGFRAAGARTMIQTFEARKKHYANVVGEFGRAATSDAVLVVGAHYDAFGDTLPGADDNASGTAGLLELARLLGRHRVQRPVMLVAYANEEPPFFGSDAMGSAIHATSLAAARRPVRGMICLEMIGYFSADQTWPNAFFELIYPSRGDFIGVTGGWSDRHLARTVKSAIAGAGGIRVVSFSGPRENSDASDQRNYWRHGWTAVVVTDTAYLRNPNYHTSSDTADTLDYRTMARVVDGVLNSVLYLSSG